MTKSRALLVSIVLLLILFLLTWKGIGIAEQALRASAEARRLVGLALGDLKSPADEAALFRRARELDRAYDRSGCERGVALERQGQWALAADAFRACTAADPEEALAYYAYGQALWKAYGRKSALEACIALRRFSELAANPSAQADPAIRRRAQTLTFDLEDLLGQDVTAGRKRYSVAEILEILTRPQGRGSSRYDGPRVPLSFAFRPGDAELGTAAEEQLQDVAKVLRYGLLREARIRIEGNTDSVEGGSRAARLALSQRRSEAVQNFLIKRCGIPRSRLTVAALAEDYPRTSNETEEGREVNRRVELVNLEDKLPLRADVRDRR